MSSNASCVQKLSELLQYILLSQKSPEMAFHICIIISQVMEKVMGILLLPVILLICSTQFWWQHVGEI